MEKREVWQERVREWRASGQGPADYCRGKGFTRSALGYWVKKLGEAEPVRSAKTHRIARVVRSRGRSDAPRRAADAESGASANALFVIEAGSVKVHVPSTLDVERLESVLIAVARATTKDGAE